MAYNTNGMYASPLHRVRAAEKQNRISTVFFYYPNYDADGKILNENLSKEDVNTRNMKDLSL